MARPKKTEVNGNTLQSAELNDVALSLVRDPINQDWVITKIKYDYGSKETSEPEILVRERDKSLIQERFRILIAQLLF